MPNKKIDTSVKLNEEGEPTLDTGDFHQRDDLEKDYLNAMKAHFNFLRKSVIDNRLISVLMRDILQYECVQCHKDMLGFQCLSA